MIPVKRTPIYLTDEELELWKWCWKNYKILNYARQIKLGSTTLHSDKEGNIKAEFKIWSLPAIDRPVG